MRWKTYAVNGNVGPDLVQGPSRSETFDLARPVKLSPKQRIWRSAHRFVRRVWHRDLKIKLRVDPWSSKARTLKRRPSVVCKSTHTVARSTWTRAASAYAFWTLATAAGDAVETIRLESSISGAWLTGVGTVAAAECSNEWCLRWQWTHRNLLEHFDV